MDDFRFSPRPNRASDIAWMPWGTDAFDRARSEDKPILLSISAVWCHWCHVMDETSYSDSEVIATINERFVPVRVDNDRRPDVNARYNMGGWPTTAFLSPDGSTLTGATYLPPAQMRRALDEIANFYAGQKGAIAERAHEMRSQQRASYRPSSSDDLRESMIVRLSEELLESYDDEYGGFGDAPKFPQPEMLEYLLAEWRLSREQRLYEVVAKTMLGMSRGGTYDRVEGGFFRYSTTRDWSVPHFEKMAEDHAGLLRVLAQLVLFGSAPVDFHTTLVSAYSYLRDVLRDPKTGLFAGSQDADEEYYALPLEERRAHGSPYVDRTSYTNWTCGLAGALAWTARALDDDAILAQASQCLDYVHDALLDDDGLAYHFVEPNGKPHVRGLLTDQVAYLRALLDAHETSGEPRFLERAEALARATIARFAAEDGGFYDRTGGEALGRLDVADRPIVDNGLLAESLLRLATLTRDNSWRDAAERTLALFARTYAAAGPFAAPYARALRRYLSPEVAVRIAGDAKATSGFREAAVRLPNPFVSIRTAPSGAPLNVPEEPRPAAYVCLGTVCGSPATDPASIRAAYDDLSAVKHRA